MVDRSRYNEWIGMFTDPTIVDKSRMRELERSFVGHMMRMAEDEE